MCILFIYNGSQIQQSDYSLIVISNRDEKYDRASQSMTSWPEDPQIFGGRDRSIADGGTWLGLAPSRNKLGVLLNLPGENRPSAASRGRLVTDYIKDNKPIKEYIEDISSYTKDCNYFIFVAVEISQTPSIYSYNNITNELTTHNDIALGFGNCLPDAPLKKVEAGIDALKQICEKYNKVEFEEKLVENLLELLKSNERYLPDVQLETKRPAIYKELSSIYVSIPHGRYGTRTHTLLLLTKTGRLSVTEFTMEAPIDPLNPSWKKSEFTFDISR